MPHPARAEQGAHPQHGDAALETIVQRHAGLSGDDTGEHAEAVRGQFSNQTTHQPSDTVCAAMGERGATDVPAPGARARRPHPWRSAAPSTHVELLLSCCCTSVVAKQADGSVLSMWHDVPLTSEVRAARYT